MARTKGSKNKPVLLTIDERIAKTSADIESLQTQLKEKKVELKALNSEKEEMEKKRILEAINASDKTPDEILAFLGKE